MKKFLLILLSYGMTMNFGECQTPNNYLNHLVFLDGETFTCLGVLTDSSHALFNGNCAYRRNFTNHGILGVYAGELYSNSIIKTSKNYRNVIGSVTESDCPDKLRSPRIQNCFILLTLESKFEVGSNLRVTKLPTSPITQDTVGSIVGWHNKCSTRSDQRIVVADISVVASNLCSDLKADEFCAMDTMTERILPSSPVISGDTIIGFSTFGCGSSHNNPITDLYLHKNFMD